MPAIFVPVIAPDAIVREGTCVADSTSADMQVPGDVVAGAKVLLHSQDSARLADDIVD